MEPRGEPAATSEVRERAAAELAEALLPVIRRYLRLSVEEFRTVESSFEVTDEGLCDEELLRRVEARQEEGHAIGWCLGVLAAASGTDVLLARREQDGLRELVELVQIALGDRPLWPATKELPRVEPSVGAGWELPFLVAWAFLRAGICPPTEEPLRWGLMEHRERQTFFVACGPDRDVGPWSQLVQLVDGAEAIEEDDGFGVVLPAGTLLA